MPYTLQTGLKFLGVYFWVTEFSLLANYVFQMKITAKENVINDARLIDIKLLMVFLLIVICRLRRVFGRYFHYKAIQHLYVHFSPTF